MKIKNLPLAILLLSLFAFNSGFAQQKLIHYWHFNNFSLTSSTAVNPSTIVPLKADYSSLDTNNAFIAYRTITGTSSAYLSYWDNVSPGDTTNARLGFPAGVGLRPRNPWDSMQLMFFIPTLNYQNITIKYATQRSGSGPTTQTFDYSLDSGLTYIRTGLSDTTFTVTSTANPMNFKSVSISNPAVNNRKSLIFRIRFGPAPGAGNNRFDNVTVEGDTLITASPMYPPMYTISQINHTNATTGTPDSLNSKATIQGIVYGFNQKTSTGGFQFTLRDNTGGIAIYHASNNFGYNVTEGDSIQVSGTIAVNRGLTELVPDSMTKLGSGKALKTPTPVSQLSQVNESDLVKMNNLVFYTMPSGGVWPASNSNVLCHTSGFTDTVVVSVLTNGSLAGTALPTATTFSATGLVTQVSSSVSAPFADNGFMLIPRRASDIISGISAPDSLTNLTAPFKTLTSIKFTWTKPATYIDSLYNTLVFIKQGSSVTAGIPNKSYLSYTANANFATPGTAFQNDASAYCVLNSDSNNVTVSGLMQNNMYYLLVYSVRKSDSMYSIGSMISAITANNIPTPVTGLTVSGVTGSSIKISWVKPPVYDNNVHSTLVFVKANSAITAGTPTKGVNAYSANTTFSSGTAYQNDAAAYCVYNGDSSFVTVTGLTQGITYNVLAWTIRNADSLYASAPTIGSGNPLPPPPLTKLIHYWNFNNLTSSYTASSVANSFRTVGVAADFSTLDTGKAKIYYRTFDGVSDSYLTFWDNVAGDTVNARMNATGGLAFRARNPSDSMMLMFYLPTQHYKNIKISYACEKSSIASGAYQQNYDYSTDAGKTWKTSGLNMTLDSTIGIVYTPVYLSFPNDTLASNNPNLVLRIKFVVGPNGVGSPSGLSGNNRFDNLAVEGDTTTATPQPIIYYGVSETSTLPLFEMYPNPSGGQLFIHTLSDQNKNIEIMDITGKILIEEKLSGNENQLNISSLTTGLYFVKVTQNSKTGILKLLRN